MIENLVFREIHVGEEPEVCRMIADCFNEFVAPDYCDEGRSEFLKYLAPDFMSERLIHNRFLMVAVNGDVIAGAVEVRAYNHISLFFVKKEYQRQGIARQLLTIVQDRCRKTSPENDFIEVFSSPFAVNIYEKLGFIRVDVEKTVNGIRYTPMKLKIHPVK